MDHHSWHLVEPVRRLARRGAALVEYALVISVIVAAMAAATAGLGAAASRSFLAVGPLGERHSPATAARTSETSTGETPRPADELLASQNWNWLVALQTAGIGLCVASWLAVQRHNRKNAQARRPSAQPELPSVIDPGEYLFVKRQQILAALSRATDELAGGQIAVRRLMSKPTACVTPTATREEVAAAMAKHRTHHLLVCEDGRLVGVISDRDLARAARGGAAEIMTANPVTVEPDTALSPAVTLMIRKRISCLPVVEGESVCGVFTTTDLVMTLQCAFQLLQRAPVDSALLEEEPLAEPARD